MTNGNDFDADLAELGRIRFTLEDMKRYGLHGGLPQEQAFFLLGFIDKLWKEYVRLQAESEAWDKLSLVQLHEKNQRLRIALLDLYNGTAEYVYLNNLGDPHNTTPMRRASEVLGVAYPRSLGEKTRLRPSSHEPHCPTCECGLLEKTAAACTDRRSSEPEASHYCIDCNEAHDPRTCGALKSAEHPFRANCTCPSDTELDPRCPIAFPHPWHAQRTAEQ